MGRGTAPAAAAVAVLPPPVPLPPSASLPLTPPPFRGKGYAAEIVARAVAELEERGDREIIPVCWYVAEWFDRHPEHAGILKARA